MLFSNEATAKRIATLGFAPPSRVNLPTLVSYTDIDDETGEQARIPVRSEISKRSQEEVFQAFLKMLLVELAHELRVDPKNPPSWVPEIDEVLDANLKLTAGEVHDRLVEEIISEENGQAVQPLNQLSKSNAGSSVGGIYDLPRLFSEISLVFEDVMRQGGVHSAFIDPNESTRDELIHHAIWRVTSPVEALREMFDLQTLDISDVKLEAGFIDSDVAADPVGEVSDLVIATSFAWAANLATSAERHDRTRLGFWLCNSRSEKFSKTIALDVRSSVKGVEVDLALSDSVGRRELEIVNSALEALVHHWAFGTNYH